MSKLNLIERKMKQLFTCNHSLNIETNRFTTLQNPSESANCFFNIMGTRARNVYGKTRLMVL